MFENFRDNDEALVRVESLIQSGGLKEAAAELNALQQRTTDDARIYSMGSELAFAAKNFPAAVSSAERASEMNPNWVHPRYQIARALNGQGKLIEALAECRAIIARAPRYLPAIELAVTVCRQQDDVVSAEKLLTNANRFEPENRRIWIELGHTLWKVAPDRAIGWYEKVLDAEPTNVSALIPLAELLHEQGKQAQALELVARAEQTEPSSEYVMYHAAKIRGEQPTHIPQDIVRNMFDEYSTRFDRQLVSRLKYRVPQIVAEKIRQRFPSLEINVLDLGCGTGLLGAALGRINGYFVGVDLSEKMARQADVHGVYQRFHIVDACEALAATNSAEYEVIAANDMLIYVGRLETFVSQAARVLRPGGVLYFTCELATEDEEDVVLRKTHRYAHRKDYATKLCTDNGLQLAEVEALVVRYEAQEPINGFLVCAQKPAEQ